LYVETEPFDLSAFGFLASRLPLSCPFAIASSLCWFHFGFGDCATVVCGPPQESRASWAIEVRKQNAL
jgi:hypothetical protein